MPRIERYHSAAKVERIEKIRQGRSLWIADLTVLSVGSNGEYKLPLSGVRMKYCRDRTGAQQ